MSDRHLRENDNTRLNYRSLHSTGERNPQQHNRNRTQTCTDNSIHNTSETNPQQHNRDQTQARTDNSIVSDSESDSKSEESDGSQDRTVVDTSGIDEISQNLSQFSISSQVNESNNSISNQVSEGSSSTPYEMNNEAEKQKLVSSQESLRDDIDDFIDENPIDDLLMVDDVNACISKMEDLRSKVSKYKQKYPHIRPH